VDGLAPVMKDGLCGYVDREGRLVVPLKFDSAARFSEGLAYAAIGSTWGYIDTNGDWAVGPFTRQANPSGTGATYASYLSPIVFGAGRFSSGLAPVSSVPRAADAEWDYIDKTGNRAFEGTFQEATEFSEGLAAVKVGDKWGFIDTQGRMVIEPQFYDDRSIWATEYWYTGFSEGLAPVSVGHFKWGYIDKSGNFVIEPQYLCTSFYGGVARVAPGGISQEGEVRWSVIDKTGRVIYPVATDVGDATGSSS
jgi:hypothetical protein